MVGVVALAAHTADGSRIGEFHCPRHCDQGAQAKAMTKRLLAALVLIWLLGFLVFVSTLSKAAGNIATDGVVVLTGGQDRVQRGVDVLQRQLARRLLISGVDPDLSLDNLATSFHIPSDLAACCIDMGWQAVDTYSNAIETADWVKKQHFKSIRIVTNNWHMTRARFELARALPPDVTIVSDAVEVSPSIGILIEEYNKYLWRRFAALFETGH